MGLTWVKEFRGGLDDRRLIETSEPNTLLRCKDAFINSGGEIEQRADFIPVWSSAAGTEGLAHDDGSLVVFGSDAEPAGIPEGFRYIQIQHPTEPSLHMIQDWTRYNNEVVSVGVFNPSMVNDRSLFFESDRATTLAGEPFCARPHVSKLFAGTGRRLHFTAVESEDFVTGTGAGFIDYYYRQAETRSVRAIAEFEGMLAVFSPRTVHLYNMDPDPDLSQTAQLIQNVGTYNPRAIVSLGDDLLFYDHYSGFRSLRARGISNSVSPQDIGNPIDNTVRRQARGISTNREQRLICAAIEPRSQTVWFAIQSTIYVLSHYPGSGITAWSTIEPGFPIEYMTVFGDHLYVRSGDTIYVYGAEPGPALQPMGNPYQYSADVKAEVRLPYLDADEPARKKILRGIDAAARGTWDVAMGFDPEHPDIEDGIARITGTTYGLDDIPEHGEATHFSPRFRSVAPKSSTEPAILASVVVHHDLHEDSD